MDGLTDTYNSRQKETRGFAQWVPPGGLQNTFRLQWLTLRFPALNNLGWQNAEPTWKF